eukprot:CAMPEP_0172374926 /NCGR_PEP_ID=MMETSP1060-20121228/58349_1 /TAXON_ID=37318 /ORGANISM="Pseudo-nitzschia pungens, Strain cf. cingulata" /LENGTH=723 /DNA_ID=CAMNT_0013101805 /DNA_START=136 /DNA_END=2307 /DNA_ORIENTATION=-
MTRLVVGVVVGFVALSLLASMADAWVPQSCGGRTGLMLQQNMVPAHQQELEQGKPEATVTEEPTVARSSVSSSLSWVEIGRTLELLGITWQDFISPLSQGLLSPDNERPSDWNAFWELSLKPQETASLGAKQRLNPTNTILVAEQFTHYLERLGPTYAKFGQALSSRPDVIPRSLAIALTRLQDDIEVLETGDKGLNTAKGARELLREEYTTNQTTLFRDDSELESFLNSLSEIPVAAATIGVVYSGVLPESLGGQKVAIKIQRPNVKEIVRKDARLLRKLAEWVEAIPSFAPSDGERSDTAMDRFVRTDITGAVDEFMTRLEEELDYRREADNLELFGNLYSHRRSGKTSDSLPTAEDSKADNAIVDTNKIRVVVPEVHKNLCTDRVLVMEWIDGIKLVDLQQEQRKQEAEGMLEEFETSRKETLELIRQGIDCTLSQLLETGILHADPHGGNLLKVADEDTASYRLGYIDFGLLSTIPTTVQDGLICAVCQLIFAKNVTAVGELFGELMLLPEDVLNDPVESEALATELNLAISQVLVFPSDGLPSLRFDKLLDVLVRLVPRFRFQLPPYFLNNARALGTLEGMAREADPKFNILRHLYPYAISRLFSNPTSSPVVEKTLRSLIETPSTGKLDLGKLRCLLRDASMYSGYSKRRVLSDIARSRSGPRLVRRLIREQSLSRGVDALAKTRRKRRRKENIHEKKRPRRRKRRLLGKVANYLRL